MATIQEIKRKTKEDGTKRKSSFFIPIPISIIEGFGWKRGDIVNIEIMGKDKLKLERKKTSSENEGIDL